MDNFKTIIVAGIVAAVASAFVLTVAPAKTVIQDRPVGAVSSPDINSPYFSFGGVRHWGGRTESLNQASTTVCAIQSPAATSTLLHASIRLDVSSSTASTVHIARGTGPTATTTLLGVAVAVAANAQSYVVATTTAPLSIFAPNQWLVVGMQGGSGTFSPTGVCEATWVSI